MPPVIRCGREAGSSFYPVGYYFYTYYITLYGKGAVFNFQFFGTLFFDFQCSVLCLLCLPRSDVLQVHLRLIDRIHSISTIIFTLIIHFNQFSLCIFLLFIRTEDNSLCRRSIYN